MRKTLFKMQHCGTFLTWFEELNLGLAWAAFMYGPKVSFTDLDFK
jgi:hypothetical protein